MAKDENRIDVQIPHAELSLESDNEAEVQQVEEEEQSTWNLWYMH